MTLDVERLPVVNLRVMPVDEIGEENACPLEEQLGAMQGLVEAGELEAFGVSNVSTEQARVALDAGAVCVQNAYNLLMRDDGAGEATRDGARRARWRVGARAGSSHALTLI